MNLRRLLMFAITFSLLAASAMPAAAGGWATIELEEPVSKAIVGEEIVLSIAVRQHGESLVHYDEVQVTATHAESEESIEVMAEPTASVGLYSVPIIFPELGRWNLEAEELEVGFHSSFPTLLVLEAGDVDPGGADATVTNAQNTVEVDIVNTVFDPAVIEIEAGTTVQWTNQDPIKHEIAFLDLAIDDSGIIEQKATFRYTFDEPGEYHFVCGPHPGMSGRIVVK